MGHSEQQCLYLVINPPPSCMVPLKAGCSLVVCVGVGLTASRSMAQRWMMPLQVVV